MTVFKAQRHIIRQMYSTNAPASCKIICTFKVFLGKRQNGWKHLMVVSQEWLVCRLVYILKYKWSPSILTNRHPLKSHGMWAARNSELQLQFNFLCFVHASACMHAHPSHVNVHLKYIQETASCPQGRESIHHKFRKKVSPKKNNFKWCNLHFS